MTVLMGVELQTIKREHYITWLALQTHQSDERLNLPRIREASYLGILQRRGERLTQLYYYRLLEAIMRP